MSVSDGLLPPDYDAPVIRNVHPLCTELRAWIKYDPKTGELIRLKSGKSSYIGKPLAVTDHYDTRGYLNRTIYVNGRHYVVGVALWCYMTGYMPTRRDAVVCADGDWFNLKFDNLRLMSKSEYLHITQGNIGEKYGVSKTARGRPSARIRAADGSCRCVLLGRFETEQEARIAYLRAKKSIRDEVKYKYGITNINRVAVRRPARAVSVPDQTAA